MPTSHNGHLPDHIGIIMDGNGRWAEARGLPRTEGHREGLSAAKKIVRAARETGIRYLTLYAFSTENWKRTKEEVGFLMFLIKKHLSGEIAFYDELGIRVIHSGDIDGLPEDIRKELALVSEKTARHSAMTVNIAINYGGRDEIIRAVRKMTDRGLVVSEDILRSCLDHPDIPDPDLIIRTGGEYRLSNFLLWGSAYSELFFSDALWPDWSPQHLLDAINSYSARNRRFGGVQQ